MTTAFRPENVDEMDDGMDDVDVDGMDDVDAADSDSMKLNCDSYDISSVSQSVFPGPNPLVLQRPQKYSVFPEAIVRATWPAAG